jgi:hypothetical protein
MKESLKGGQRRNGNSGRLGEIQAPRHWRGAKFKSLADASNCGNRHTARSLI